MRAHAHSRARANVNPSTPTLKKLLNFKKAMSSLVLPGSVSHESLIQSQSNRPFYASLTCIEYRITSKHVQIPIPLRMMLNLWSHMEVPLLLE